MSDDRRRAARRANLRRLLAPASLAFIGGARAADAIRVARDNGYAGRIYAVNPRLEALADVPCVPKVEDLPEPPDASFLVTPIEPTIAALGALDAMGAGGAVCYAAGFAELGAQGQRRQQALVEAAGDLAVVGPNCFGLINYATGASLWPIQYPPVRGGNHIAVLSQSGNLCIDFCHSQRSVPWRYIISIGNQAVLGVEDYIAHLVEDPAVRVIGLFLEGIKDVPGFHAAAIRAAERGVPIVALKSGASEAGARLALSHTSSLAGTDQTYDALFERLGVLRVRTVPELEETLKLIAVWGAEPGRRLVAFSSSGGDSGMAADFATAAGLTLPVPDERQERLVKAELPDYGQVSNPLDFTAVMWGQEEPLGRIFRALMAEGCDKAMLIADHPRPEVRPGKAVEVMVRALTAAQRATGVPAALASINPESMPEILRDAMLRDGIAPLQGLHDAMRAIGLATRYGEWRARFLVGAPPAELMPPAMVDEKAAQLVDERAAKAALARYGLKIPPSRVAGLAEVGEAAAALGFPVAIKALHEALPHKTEAGAVRLDIASPQAAAEAAAAIQRAVAAHNPAIAVEHFLVERMILHAVAELLIGVKREPQFGLVLVLGPGGVLVELIGRPAIFLLPVSRAAVEAALRQGVLGRLLAGFRGRPAGDVEAAVDAVMAVADFARANGDRLVELDINPLLVLPQGQGAVAVDAFIRIVGQPAPG